MASAAAIVALGATSAPAGAVQTSTLNYKCKYPLIGIKALSVKIDLGIPDTWPTSVPTDPFSVVATASAFDMAQGLQAVDDLTSIDGASTAFASVLTAQGFKVPAKTVATIENTILPDPVPDPLVLTATGSTPALTFDEPGTQTITLDRLAINLTARDSAGDPIVLPPVTKDIDGNKVSDSDGDSNTFDVYCKLDEGQDTTIGSFDIVEPTPTPAPPTPTPTTAPTPTPAPTTAPTPTPAPTTAPTPTPAPTTAPTPTPAPTTAPTPTPGPVDDTIPPSIPTETFDGVESDVGETFLVVRWGASVDNEGGSGLDHYVVNYEDQFFDVPADQLSYRLEGLGAESDYDVFVSAVDKAGNESLPLYLAYTTRPIGGGTPTPTPAPTTAPTPTPAPTTAPTPTPAPTTAPTPTPAPTTAPTPTPAPTTAPTPTPKPTTAPTPTPAPTTAPTPTPKPTTAPTPTPAPTTAPTPTPAPTTAPTPTPAPTTAPTPTPAPTTAPTPTPAPTTAPTPTPAPTTAPTPTPAPSADAPVVKGILGRVAYAGLGGVSIVYGSGFEGDVSVTVGGKPAMVIGKIGSTNLLVALPRLGAGTYPLVVTTSKGSSTPDGDSTVKYVGLFSFGFHFRR